MTIQELYIQAVKHDAQNKELSITYYCGDDCYSLDCETFSKDSVDFDYSSDTININIE